MPCQHRRQRGVGEPLTNPYLPTPARIEGAKDETEDTRTFKLRLLGLEEGLEVKPGQFVMVGALGVGEAPISVSAPPDGCVLQLTVRRIGKVTNALHEARVGDIVHIRGPYGRGWPLGLSEDRDLLLVGGGIGLAPLRPVILSDPRARRVMLFYGSRLPSLLLYRDEFLTWGSKGVEVNLTVDKPEPGWEGKVGVVTKLLEERVFDTVHSLAFVCGPPVMIKFTVRTLLSKGLRPEDIYVSLESRMRCGVGKCGHCHFGNKHVCLDGPVFSVKEVRDMPGEFAPL